MKLLLRCCFMALMLCLVPATQAAEPTYGQLVDALKPGNKTKAQLQSIWKEHRGKAVTWSGTLVDAKEGRHFTTLRVLDKTRKHYKGSNIAVEVRDKERAAKLRKGQTVRFKGKLDKYRQHDNGSTTVTVERAEIL